MFKVGDIVRCIDITEQGRDGRLCLNKRYVIKKCDKYIYLEGFSDYDGWYTKRFVLDVKYYRKKKLEKCLR